jgi:hypothetical protein
MNNPETIYIFFMVASLFIFTRLSLKGLNNFTPPNHLRNLNNFFLILSGILGIALLGLAGVLLISLNCQNIILVLMTFFLIGKISKYEY